MCCKCKCVSWLWNKICDFFRWLRNTIYCCCDRDYENLPGNVKKTNLPDNVRNTVCVVPFKTDDSLMKLLCELLQRVLDENNINIILKFNNETQGDHLMLFAYCCLGREEAEKDELERKSNEKDGLVVFLRKDFTRLDINNTLFVKYTETNGAYSVELMKRKSTENEEFLNQLGR